MPLIWHSIGRSSSEPSQSTICLPTIRPVTEQEDVDLRTGSIRRYPQTALAGRGRPDHGTIGRHEADLLFQSVGVGQVIGEIPFFYP